jgi:hypothetical protein
MRNPSKPSILVTFPPFKRTKRTPLTQPTYPQEVTQSAGTTPHEAEVTSSNHPSPSCVDMSKKKKKHNQRNIENISMLGNCQRGTYSTLGNLIFLFFFSFKKIKNKHLLPNINIFPFSFFF